MLSLCKHHWYYYLSFRIQIYNYLKVTLENLLEGILPQSLEEMVLEHLINPAVEHQLYARESN